MFNKPSAFAELEISLLFPQDYNIEPYPESDDELSVILPATLKSPICSLSPLVSDEKFYVHFYDICHPY
jgi:hypothetical protein